jgi:phosphate starvation-inducible PhoH-like protein
MKQHKQTRKAKIEQGFEHLPPKEKFDNQYKLDWFTPEGSQHLITEAMDDCELIVVDAPSGTGKSTTVLWKALNDYKQRKYQKVLLIKNPTEAGNDQIGFLSGDKASKLEAHMESMKSIFLQFMSSGKLENDVKNENIVLDIPNYLLGRTFDDTLILLEEAQTMSPETVKLCAERAGQGSKVVVVGDSKQRYSVKGRKDGLRDLIEKVTQEHAGYLIPKYANVGYIRMESDNNMRSSLSKFITEIYE